MPKDLTAADAFTATVPVAVEGDPRLSTDIETPVQALMNRTLFLYNLVVPGAVTVVEELPAEPTQGMIRLVTAAGVPDSIQVYAKLGDDSFGWAPLSTFS